MDPSTGSIPLTIRGRYFWRGNTRFFVRGLVYQRHRTTDPICDDCIPQLKRDMLLFQELGINTLYVYSIDNTKTHDEAMKMLDEAGIYVFATVNTPKCSIQRLDSRVSYNPSTMVTFLETIDVMARYSNTLGLLVGEGVIDNVNSMAVTQHLRAAVRDMKRYMQLTHEAVGQRILPIGYAAMAMDRSSLADLSLGDPASSLDFWACNSYEWVGQASMDISGWTSLVERTRTATIPMFLSEYGAIAVEPDVYGTPYEPRIFEETRALYLPAMCQVFSGGCVYELWQGSYLHGLVELLPREGDMRLAARRKAIARSKDTRRVFEKRESEEGTLLIYHDFVNYKRGLDASRGLEARWSESEKLFMPEVQGLPLKMQDFDVPETCLDWRQIKQTLTGGG